MNNIRLLISLLVLIWFPGSAAPSSLLDVYQQALQSDPIIHEAEALRLATLEALPQARSALLPQISAGANYGQGSNSGLQQQPQFDPVTGNVIGFVSLATNSGFETFGWNAELRQTVFRWDQFVGLKKAEKRIAKAEVDFEFAQQDLIVRVATRYFEVLGAEDRLGSIQADKLAISRQLEQAKQRFAVGLAAITDVQESQAAYDQGVASEIQAKREVATALELLREITGEYIPNLTVPKDDFPLATPEPADESSWINLAMDQNLALVSSRFDEEIARDEIKSKRTGHYPTVDLIATYDSSDTDINNVTVGGVPAPIPNFPTDSSGDRVFVQFNVPIFSGGRTSSQVREAVYLRRAALEKLQRVSRQTERAARDAYLSVVSEISRVNALEQAVKSSRTALEATQAGFEVGTRTIVDVLNSQRSLYSAITNYYQSRYNYIGNVLRLKFAAGTLHIQDLEEINRHLVDRQLRKEVIAQD